MEMLRGCGVPDPCAWLLAAWFCHFGFPMAFSDVLLARGGRARPFWGIHEKYNRFGRDHARGLRFM
jgi:hypothetical protein